MLQENSHFPKLHSLIFPDGVNCYERYFLFIFSIFLLQHLCVTLFITITNIFTAHSFLFREIYKQGRITDIWTPLKHMFTLQRHTMIENDLDVGAEYVDDYSLAEGLSNDQPSAGAIQPLAPTHPGSQYEPQQIPNYPTSTNVAMAYQDDFYSVGTPTTGTWEGVSAVDEGHAQGSFLSDYPVELDMFSNSRWGNVPETQLPYARHSLIPQMGHLLQVDVHTPQFGQLNQDAPELQSVLLGNFRPLDLFGEMNSASSTAHLGDLGDFPPTDVAGINHGDLAAMSLRLEPQLASHLTPQLVQSLHMTHNQAYQSMPTLAQTAQLTGNSTFDSTSSSFSSSGVQSNTAASTSTSSTGFPNTNNSFPTANSFSNASSFPSANSFPNSNSFANESINNFANDNTNNFSSGNNTGISTSYPMGVRMPQFGGATTPMATGPVPRVPPKKRYCVVRGISAGGCLTRPPKQLLSLDLMFVPVELKLNGAAVEDICFPKWLELEREDQRRIVRIERVQNEAELVANFSIVGAANENPVTLPAQANVDVVEVSCLQCRVRPSADSGDDSSSEEEDKGKSSRSLKSHIKTETDTGEHFQYYITSVEVVEIVELLIGTELVDPADRRRERGRVRLNLVPFWLKKPILSRMSDHGVPSAGAGNSDFRLDLARRIMGYEIRKPRGFDKEVRILRWDKLVPALKRALQSYYTEIPNN